MKRLVLLLLLATAAALFQAPTSRAAEPAGPAYANVAGSAPKFTLPRYVIEPPDILRIEGIALIPKPPYRLVASDVIRLELLSEADAPINDDYVVDAEGSINLSPDFDRVRVVGLTIDEAQCLKQVLLR